jgi:hypothetical protein
VVTIDNTHNLSTPGDTSWQKRQTAPQMQATLGLTGLTSNAMALIAPGAFLWLTFFIQATDRRDLSLHVDRDLCGPAALSGNRRLLC